MKFTSSYFASMSFFRPQAWEDSRGKEFDLPESNLSCESPGPDTCLERYKYGEKNCPPGWKSFQKSCYLFVVHQADVNLKSWDDARSKCRSFGGDLVSITSSSELSFIYNKSKKVDHLRIWIGLHRSKDSQGNYKPEGWIWSDKSKFIDLKQWAENEPNNQDNIEHCVEFVSTRKNSWNDLKCERRLSSICKKQKGIDKCPAKKHHCHKHANCVNVDVSSSCMCKNGFTGNGTFCEDLDECTIGRHRCHRDASCVNNFGSFSCICKTGFTGNGTFCKELSEQKSTKNNLVFIIPLSVVSSLLFIILLVIFCKKVTSWRRNHQRNNNPSAPDNNPEVREGQNTATSEYMSLDVSKMRPQNDYQPLRQANVRHDQNDLTNTNGGEGAYVEIDQPKVQAESQYVIPSDTVWKLPVANSSN